MKHKLFLWLILLPVLAGAQPVYQYDGPKTRLSERKAWALRQAQNREIWIGYSIQRLMSARSHFGTWSNRSDNPTIAEILGVAPDEAQTPLNKAAERALAKLDSGLVMRDVALIFLLPSPHKNPLKITAAITATFDSEIDLQNNPLYWLGSISQEESFAELKRLYPVQASSEKEDLLVAISQHSLGESTEFLISIAKSGDTQKLQEEAVFWLGQQGTPAALDYLAGAVNSHPSREVRKKAVFSISQIENDKAVQALITVAKENRDQEIRKEAIFWLGQLAFEKTAKILKGIVYDDPLLEIKKQAVFALSQQDDERSIDDLIDIAKNHPHLEVRKTAIFWLGESGSDRALQVLVEILKN